MNERTWQSIHYLRGIAAGMILVLHTVIMGGGNGAFIHELGFGVHLFFVISGFVIYTSTAKHFQFSDYIWRRAIRVYPIYWAAVAFALLLGMNSPNLSDLLLLPAEQGPVFWQPATLGVAWTLVYEVMFYAVFGIAMLAGRWWLAPCFILALVMFEPLLGSLAPYGNPIILEFAAGVLIGRFADKMNPWLLLPAIAIFFLPSGEIGSLYRALKVGLCAACLVGGALAYERKYGLPKLPAFSLMGDASYSIYLFHVPVIFMLNKLPWYVTILPCLLVGIAAHLLIEKPALKALRSLDRNAKLPLCVQDGSANSASLRSE